MVKVVIVDDEMIVRHAVKTLIRWDESRFEYVGAAANGASALELVRETGRISSSRTSRCPGWTAWSSLSG